MPIRFMPKSGKKETNQSGNTIYPLKIIVDKNPILILNAYDTLLKNVNPFYVIDLAKLACEEAAEKIDPRYNHTVQQQLFYEAYKEARKKNPEVNLDSIGIIGDLYLYYAIEHIKINTPKY